MTVRTVHLLTFKAVKYSETESQGQGLACTVIAIEYKSTAAPHHPLQRATSSLQLSFTLSFATRAIHAAVHSFAVITKLLGTCIKRLMPLHNPPICFPECAFILVLELQFSSFHLPLGNLLLPSPTAFDR